MSFNKQVLKIFFSIIILSFYIFALNGCTSTYKYYRDYEYIKNFYSFKIFSKPEEKINYYPDEIENYRKKIVQYALESIGLNSFAYNNRSFLYDCSGFIFYLYYKAGIDLNLYLVDQSPLGGVHQLYLIAKNFFSISKISFNLADIIIFDNTYDRNKNRKEDDFYTHVAIITEVKNDGTIVFVHKSNSGVQKGYMNLLKSNVHIAGNDIINSYIKDSGNNGLAAKLFNTYATFFR